MRTGLTLDQFRSTFQTGGFRSICITASESQFFVSGEPYIGNGVILKTTGGRQPKVFRNPVQAITLLHRMGVQKVEMDITAWIPAKRSTKARKIIESDTRKRPAYIVTAAHHAWFCRQVEAALIQANSSEAEWISEKEARRLGAERRTDWFRGAAE